MICGRLGRYANKANLLSDHGRFLLTEEEADAIFTRVVTAVQEDWRPAMRRAGVSEGDCEALQSAFVYEGLTYEAAEQA